MKCWCTHKKLHKLYDFSFKMSNFACTVDSNVLFAFFSYNFFLWKGKKRLVQNKKSFSDIFFYIIKYKYILLSPLLHHHQIVLYTAVHNNSPDLLFSFKQTTKLTNNFCNANAAPGLMIMLMVEKQIIWTMMMILVAAYFAADRHHQHHIGIISVQNSTKQKRAIQKN